MSRISRIGRSLELQVRNELDYHADTPVILDLVRPDSTSSILYGHNLTKYF